MKRRQFFAVLLGAIGISVAKKPKLIAGLDIGFKDPKLTIGVGQLNARKVSVLNLRNLGLREFELRQRAYVAEWNRIVQVSRDHAGSNPAFTTKT